MISENCFVSVGIIQLSGVAGLSDLVVLIWKTPATATWVYKPWTYSLYPSTAVRWLHPMKFVEIWEMYNFMHADSGTKAGRTLFREVYLTEWRRCLRIRKQSQHAVCKDCGSDC